MEQIVKELLIETWLEAVDTFTKRQGSFSGFADTTLTVRSKFPSAEPGTSSMAAALSIIESMEAVFGHKFAPGTRDAILLNDAGSLGSGSALCIASPSFLENVKDAASYLANEAVPRDGAPNLSSASKIISDIRKEIRTRVAEVRKPVRQIRASPV